MPDFAIPGNPGAVRSRAEVTSAKAQLFYDTGEGLSKIDASGWTGRAADHFRDAHDLEPDRWFKAGNGFARAGAALTTYAGHLESAQEIAVWAQGEHARGEQVTASARSSYDADVSDARAKLAAGLYSSLTIVPFDDPGAAIRSHALAELAAARSALDNAAHVCAGEVRAGCADAPEEPNWLESGLRFVGGIFEGAGEALWDLATMMPFSPINLVNDAWKLATGELTPEELLARYELTLEQAKDMVDALRDDPVEFGKALGKGLLDWDTWADDPARALGHLVPDAIAAAFTAGTAGAATRGAGSVDDIADGLRALDRVGDASDLRRLDDLDDLADLGDLRRLDDGPPSSMFERDRSDGFRDIDDQLDNPSYSPENRDIIESDYEALGRDPETGRPLTRDEFEERFLERTPDGDYPYDWKWPDHDGAVPGTQDIVSPSDVPRMDRIGGDSGAYFTDDGVGMGQRSLPPDRLNFDRSSWDIDRGHPDLADGSVRIERSEVAPHFGQEGGGVQYRFLDSQGDPLSQAELAARGIITP